MINWTIGIFGGMNFDPASCATLTWEPLKEVIAAPKQFHCSIRHLSLIMSGSDSVTFLDAVAT